MAGPAVGKVQVGQTSKFSVLDASGSKVKHVVHAPAADEGEYKHVLLAVLEELMVLADGDLEQRGVRFLTPRDGR